MGIRWFVIIIVATMILSACNLGSNAPEATAETVESPTPDGVPQVEILSPLSGDEFVVDEEILVSVQATDSVGVTRVQLLANNQIVKTVSSESLQGDLSMTALLDYTPQAEGTVVLRVLAFRGAEVSEPDSIEVVVRRLQSQITATPNQVPGIPQIPNDGVCRALVNVGLNFREGPSTDFNRIRVLSSGTLAPIIGRIGNNTWWQLSVNNSVGWVSAEFTTEFGNCFNIPIITPPTPQVTNTPIATSTNVSVPSPTTPGNNNTGEPDLIVSAIDGDRSIIVPSGVSSTTETYKVTIRNTGNGGAGQFTTTMFINDNAQDLGVLSGLSANTSHNFNVAIEFEQGGIFDIEVVVDSESQVPEISEVNNRGEISVTVAFE